MQQSNKRFFNIINWRFFTCIALYASLLGCTLDDGAKKTNLNDIRLLTPSHISDLEPTASFDTLKSRFGPSLEATHFAIGWPKAIYANLPYEQQWKRAYWFFYERDESGKPVMPLTLEFVASLPGGDIDVSPPLVKLLPQMIIDWPLSKAGQPLIELYQN